MHSIPRWLDSWLWRNFRSYRRKIMRENRREVFELSPYQIEMLKEKLRDEELLRGRGL